MLSSPILGDPIARGGMGSVYAATLDDVPVAVKVLDPDHASEPAFVRAFRTEVRAMATLHHPHIIGILDLGRFEQGAFAGSPYVVMERAESNLVGSCGRRSWDVVRRWLEQILHALAHAHARGITHRDLKPANVLLRANRVSLCDFGLARAFEAVALGQHEQPAGTPGYMPDEQRLGRWRDIGPWTDLYALGKLALDLVARPDGGSVLVPVGFDRWVSRCRQPEASERYRRAADALAGLEALPVVGSVDLLDLAGLGPTVDSTLARTQPYFQDEDVLQPALPDPAPRQAPSIPGRPIEVSQAPRARRVSIALLHSALPAGLETLADQLWAAVRTASQGTPQLLNLHGPESEVDALAFWLCHQLHETGVGSVNLATHDRHRRPTSGLAGLIGRELRCLDLERRQAQERLDSSSLADVAGELLTLMSPVLGGESGELSVERQFELADRVLMADAEGRLPFIWVQRGHHADDVLEFIAWRARRPGAFLALITSTEALAVEGATILAAAQPEPEVMQARLTEALVLTESIDVEALARRSGGQPSLARVLLDDPDPNASVGEAWQRRLAPFLQTVEQRRALVAAAVLGDLVEQGRWLDTLRRARIPLDDGLLEAVLQAGVAVPVGLAGHVWRFASLAVRRLVLDAAKDDLGTLHRAAGRTYPVEPSTALVRAHHARMAGEVAEARQILLGALPFLEGRDPHRQRAVTRALTQVD